MKRFTSRCVSSQSPCLSLRIPANRSYVQCRALHHTSIKAATAHPITAPGPPPKAPEVSGYGEKVDRRRRRAEMLKQGKEIRESQSGKSGSVLRKRFWKDVHVKEVQGRIKSPHGGGHGCERPTKANSPLLMLQTDSRSILTRGLFVRQIRLFSRFRPTNHISRTQLPSSGIYWFPRNKL